MVNQELMHWGIKGMKWGFRRYQNHDGSLTAAGKKRYNKEMAKAKAEEKLLKSRQRTQAKLDKLNALKKSNADLKNELDGKNAKPEKVEKQKSINVNKVIKKDLKDMSNEEIQAVIDRVTLENKYKEVTNEAKDKGRGFVEKFLSDIVKPPAEDTAKQLAKSLMVGAVNKHIDDEGLKLYTNNQKKK